jgi:type I restriction enzyme S subunit
VVQRNPSDVPDAVYLGLEHLAPGRMRSVGSGSASDVQSHKSVFQRNDVLYGKLRPYLDKAVLADEAGVCTTELLVLRPKPGVVPSYLACVVHDPDFVEHAMAGVTGAHHPRTSWSHISTFTLPRRDQNEQQAIARVVWNVHDLLQACERSAEAAVRLKQIAMRDVFAQGLSGGEQRETEFGLVPATWGNAVLESVAAVQTGVAKGRKFADAEMIDVPYLRVANVQDGHLDLSEMKTISIRRSEVERYRLQDGDVVLTEGGDFDKLGRGFIWRGELELCVHQNHVFAVRPNADVLVPDFFAYLAQSSYGKAYFLQVAHKTTNLACINTTKLKAFPVLLPSIEEQQEIVSILASLDRKIGLQREKREVLEALFKALLHKLLIGEIRVDQLNLSAVTREAGAAA